MQNNGFKRKECNDRNGMACHSKPPTIESKIVKSLNVSYCKMDPKDTTEDILQKKRTKMGGKPPKPTGVNDGQQDEN